MCPRPYVNYHSTARQIRPEVKRVKYSQMDNILFGCNNFFTSDTCGIRYPYLMGNGLCHRRR